MARLRRLRTVRHVSVQQPWRDKVDVYRLVVKLNQSKIGGFCPLFFIYREILKNNRIIYHKSCR
jgi:hypothetical protein